MKLADGHRSKTVGARLIRTGNWSELEDNHVAVGQMSYWGCWRSSKERILRLFPCRQEIKGALYMILGYLGSLAIPLDPPSSGEFERRFDFLSL